MRIALAALSCLVAPLALVAQTPDTPVQLTIYNGNFAVARTTIPLDLHAGINQALTTDVTTQLEPDSVILRDPTGRHTFRILEQNYDAGVVNQEWLLKKYEGKTIFFQVGGYGGVLKDGQMMATPPSIVEGKIIRAGAQPLIEVNGHMQFALPGTPLFPPSTDDLLLKPTLRWAIESSGAAKFPAELAYITQGMAWQATYNVVLPESPTASGPEKAELIGWVTINNNTGTDFPRADIKLMAGDVAKLLPVMGRSMGYGGPISMNSMALMADGAPSVTQKAFDDFHLYDLHRTVALPSGESKQVEFLDAAGVTVDRSYEFDGSRQGVMPAYTGYHNISRDLPANTDAHVNIREEIHNTEANHLGMPLPAGRIRLYRRENSGAMQFVGEGMVEHTPQDRSLHLNSGQSFDITANRRQTDFHVDNNGHNMDETIEVKLHNAKAQAATVHTIEHLNRAQNWQITEKSSDYTKTDSNTIDFAVEVPAHGDTTLTYSVHYTW